MYGEKSLEDFHTVWSLTNETFFSLYGNEQPRYSNVMLHGRRKLAGDMRVGDKILTFGWTFPLGCGVHVSDRGVGVFHDFPVPKQQKGHK